MLAPRQPKDIDLEKAAKCIVENESLSIRHLDKYSAYIKSEGYILGVRILKDGTVTTSTFHSDRIPIIESCIYLLNKGIELISLLKSKSICEGDYHFSIIVVGLDEVLHLYSKIVDVAKYLGSLQYANFEIECLEKSKTVIRVGVKPKGG